MEGGIAAPQSKNPLSGPVAYSAGFHTAADFQIVTSQAGISPKSTWNRTMLLKGTWIWGAIYAHSDQINGGIAAPQSKNPLSGPVAYSAGFHTAAAFQIVSAQAENFPESA